MKDIRNLCYLINSTPYTHALCLTKQASKNSKLALYLEIKPRFHRNVYIVYALKIQQPFAYQLTNVRCV